MTNTEKIRLNAHCMYTSAYWAWMRISIICEIPSIRETHAFHGWDGPIHLCRTVVLYLQIFYHKKKAGVKNSPRRTDALFMHCWHSEWPQNKNLLCTYNSPHTITPQQRRRIESHAQTTHASHTLIVHQVEFLGFNSRMWHRTLFSEWWFR